MEQRLLVLHLFVRKIPFLLKLFDVCGNALLLDVALLRTEVGLFLKRG